MRWLRNHLQKHSHDFLLQFFSTMYPEDDPLTLSDNKRQTLQDFVAALRLLVDPKYHLLAILR